jgi:hypothetical protein
MNSIKQLVCKMERLYVQSAVSNDLFKYYVCSGVHLARNHKQLRTSYYVALISI